MLINAIFIIFYKIPINQTFCEENGYFIFLIGEAKGCGAAGGQGDRVSHQPQEKSGQKVEKVKV